MPGGDLENVGRVVITLYHLFVTFTIVVFGAWKAAAVSQGKSIVSDTLDWVVGIIIGVVLFALSEIKGYRIPALDWFFRRDLRDTVWGYFGEPDQDHGDNNINRIECGFGTTTASGAPKLTLLLGDTGPPLVGPWCSNREGEQVELVLSPEEESAGQIVDGPTVAVNAIRRRTNNFAGAELGQTLS